MAARPKHVPQEGLKLKVKRASAGLGLFAGEDIKKGTCLIEYTGPLVTNKEADEINSRYLFAVNQGKTIDGSGRDNKARYVNHGCRPNAETDVYKNRVFITAIKNIKAGDEITYNYGKEYFNQFIKPYGCRCGRH